MAVETSQGFAEWSSSLAAMRIRKRRTVSWLVSAVLLVVVSVVVFIAAMVGRPEQVDRLWASATIDSRGNASLVEVIDYDFASQSHHGVFRVVPDLDAENSRVGITASSPDAPDQLQIIPHAGNTELRIGDPAITVKERHRYEIRYPLSTLVQGNTYAWNVSGNDWNVAMRDVEAHLVAPYALTDIRCAQGKFGSQSPCTVSQPEPGHLVVHVENLGAHEGITVYALRAAPLSAAPATPQLPPDQPSHSDINPLAVALLVLVICGAGIGAAALLVLRAGRERVATGGAADVAWATNDGPFQRIDALKLASLATVDFAPPAGLSPSQGGVLLSESVAANHQAAWIMQASVDGFVTIEGTGKNVIIRRNPVNSGYATPVLDRAFQGADTIALGSYNASFAAAWKMIGADLDGWRKRSGLWEPSSDLRVMITRALGGLLFAGAGVCTVWSAAKAAAQGGAWVAVLIATAFVFGVAIAATLFASELRVRTPQGSGLWLRTESFRRFLHESEARHVEYAAEHNMLREYTAWAVALGEVKRWTAAMNASTIAPQLNDNDAFFTAAPYFAAVAASASTEPSSSSSDSGGGGGSVGGGGGGGGGGSW
jgi:hypothetical protein